MSSGADGADGVDGVDGADGAAWAGPELSGASLELEARPDAKPKLRLNAEGLAHAHPFDLDEADRLRGGALLGRGGLGEVRSARDLRLNREIAVKAARVRGSAAERRLVLEAWITARLEHPGIVPIYDAGRRADGALYYSMRRIRGRTLAEALAEGPNLSLSDSQRTRLLRRFLDACEALAFAHSRGVVHRDVKPANILVGDYGETLVADWGLACFLPGREPADLPSTGRREGEVVGTPGYMAPEQLRGEVPTPRVDVYSLGRILDELVGREGPAQLRSVARRATADEPEARYPDAGALGEEIERWLDGRQVEAHHYSLVERLARVARRRALALAVAAVALLLIIVVTALGVLRTTAERDRARDAELAAQGARERAEFERARAEDETDRAEANLGRALVARALDAAAGGLRAEAETAAAHALAAMDPAEMDAADARGVLARFGAEARPTSLGRSPLPRCDLARVDSHGRTRLCFDAGRLVRREIDTEVETALDLSPTLALEDAVHLGASEAVLLITTDRDTQAASLRRWDLDGGAVEVLAQVRQTQGLSAAPDQDRAIQVKNGKYFRIDPSGAMSQISRPCQPSTTVLAVAGPEQREVLACADGRVLSFEAGVGPQELLTIPAERGHPFALAFSSASASPPALAVGTARGWVFVLELGSGSGPGSELEQAPVHEFQASRQPIRDLALVHTGTEARCAVLGEDGRGGVWLLGDLAHPIAHPIALPGRSLALRFVDGDTLRSVSADAVEDWRLPPTPLLRVRRGGAGISALEPLGHSRVATADGDGRVQIWSPTGALEAELWIEGGVVKDLAQAPGGSFGAALGPELAVVAIGRPGLTLLDGQLRALAYFEGVRARRVMWAGPDLVLALPYGPGPRRLSRGDASGGFFEVPGAVDGRLADGAAFPDNTGAWIVSETGQTWSVSSDPRRAPRPGPRIGGANSIVGNATRVYLGTPGSLIAVDLDGGDRVDVRVTSMIHDLALSDAHGLLASGHGDGSVEVRDAATLELLMVLRGHEARVASLRFDPEQPWLWTGSWDGSTRAWSMVPARAEPGALVAEVEGAWRRSLVELLR